MCAHFQEFEKKLFQKTMRSNARMDGNSFFECKQAARNMQKLLVASAQHTVGRTEIRNSPSILHIILAEVLLIQKMCCAYKFESDVHFYVLASENENELVVLSVLNALEESLVLLLGNRLCRSALLQVSLIYF